MSTGRAAEISALPTDLSELARQLQLSIHYTELLRQLADESVSRFASDDDATAWFENEVRSRYPNLWWSIREWLARRSLSSSR